MLDHTPSLWLAKCCEADEVRSYDDVAARHGNDAWRPVRQCLQHHAAQHCTLRSDAPRREPLLARLLFSVLYTCWKVGARSCSMLCSRLA